MKYIVMLGDGMADRPVKELDNKTPLQYANNKNMNLIAQNGIVGMAKTVPNGMPPGSDTANLSVMGYSPKKYYTGRSPLEAVSMGIPMTLDDVSFRCNLVNLSIEDNFEDATMIDYSSDEITTEESTVLINYINDIIKSETLNLYPGISYRHCLLLKNAKTGTKCTPPHDITLKPIKEYLPSGEYGEFLLNIMKKSYELLENHPINIKRKEKGLKTANSCWFWGEGTKPNLTSFKELYNVKGSVVSAVDLIKGIGICAGLNVIEVDGATGNINTNFKGKAKASIDALLNGDDFIYIHVEAADESGHRHEIDNKVLSIEKIDEEILGPVMSALDKANEDYAILLMPDHPTPLDIRTHTSDAVPFVLYRSDKKQNNGAKSYDEESASKTGLYIDDGSTLMKKLITLDF